MAGTVTVACKLPNGLDLMICEEFTTHEAVMGGGTREVKAFRPTGRGFHVKGNSAPHGVQIHTPGGYALTTGIDADMWDAWLAQNKESPLVKNHMVFALPREDSATSKAKEQAEVISGLERLDMSKPFKVGNGLNVVAGNA